MHAGKLTVAADVAVKESRKVEKGQVLFTLDPEPFPHRLRGAEANLGIVRNEPGGKRSGKLVRLSNERQRSRHAT